MSSSWYFSSSRKV